uniref:PDZ domain-containing protein n=1 Tax=Acanthochromis polyacanthus TaxID=80966 RepID=A0A3Q1EQS6_9TELE
VHLLVLVLKLLLQVWSGQVAHLEEHMFVNSDALNFLLQVSIVRGTDGFGFTICCDCPVRVQAVDPDGPAHRSGLRQGDSVLQLNGLPVETWKCVDLAHIFHLIWFLFQFTCCLSSGAVRLRSSWGCGKLLSHPSYSKHSRRRGQETGVRSSLGALGFLWRDWKEDREVEEDQEEPELSRHTATMKGTRVTSSNGDNYIILSSVSPGGQVSLKGRGLQVSPEPSFTKRQNLFWVHQNQHSPHNYGNYQNCTIVQSHLPCSGYGTYVTLAPKTLIFPVFVQVMVLIYSDLLLLTREDECGRCNVLQSPVYLNTLHLRDVLSEPLRIYLLQNSQSCCRVLFSLEAFSVEQKVRVSLCLHDNMQLVATKAGHSHQVRQQCFTLFFHNRTRTDPQGPGTPQFLNHQILMCLVVTERIICGIR